MFDAIIEYLSYVGAYVKSALKILLTIFIESFIFSVILVLPIQYLIGELFYRNIAFMIVFAGVFTLNTLSFMLSLKETTEIDLDEGEE